MRAVVIGGGPGGLMAAELLAEGGLQVDLYEHMPSVGRKLLLAGRGGLNITHSEPTDALMARYGAAPAQLADSIRRFDAAALRDWCRGLGEETFVGSSGRVFPRSFRATPLLRAWLHRLDSVGVRVHTRHRWLGWADGPEASDPHRLRMLRPDGVVDTVHADVTVLALGGASWPRVGSDGGWVAVLHRAGVRVADLRPANCGVRIVWTPGFAQRCAGVPLKNVAISVAGSAASGEPAERTEQARPAVRGDAMITSHGLEGGPIYALGAAIRRGLDAGGAALQVDLQPDLSVAQVAARLTKRRPKDSLSTSLRRTVGLSPVAVDIMREATANRLPGSTVDLAALVKSMPLPVEGVMPIARAISTAGGVAFDEIDESFMLRALPSVFVVGEMLDWEAPTGGYLLQATFSTAVAAAAGALAYVHSAVVPSPGSGAGR